MDRKQISTYCCTSGSRRITGEQAVFIILNNRTTVPYLRLPECSAVQLLKCRQEEFPSGPEECCICTKVSAQAGGMESQPQPACKINTPEATADEWEVPFPFDKDVGKAKGCIYLFAVMWTLIYLMLWFWTCLGWWPARLTDQFLLCWLGQPLHLGKSYCCQQMREDTHWNFYSGVGVRGVGPQSSVTALPASGITRLVSAEGKRREETSSGSCWAHCFYVAAIKAFCEI